MSKVRWSLSLLGAATLLVSACGRGDDSSTDTTASPATTVAETTVPAETTTVATPGTETTEPATTAAPTTTAAPGTTAVDIADKCASEPLQATEVGVSDSEITIEVMADTGSALAPGLFQANIDAVKAYADHANENGGIGCRKVVVKVWDSKLDPTEAKNGQIDACANAVALVGGNTLFNPDVSAMTGCVDKAGQPTGLPDMAALTSDTTELCAATTFTIQPQAESCPIAVGSERNFTVLVAPFKRLIEERGPLHGIYMVPGDLPTTRQSAIAQLKAQEAVGITFDGTPIVSGRDEQAAFTPRVQILKQANGNFVYDGLNQTAMIKLQKEAAAQGIDLSTIAWTCGIACYTNDMLQDPTTAEGTVVWLNFLPFDEGDTNAELQAYLDSVGADKANSFGAQAWQAAVAFQQVVDQIVATDGPNAITRAKILEGLASIQDFTANGWAGTKSLRGISNCYVMLTVHDGKFVRTWPEERGTLDCNPDNLVTVSAEPVSEAEALG
jgi:ABC-type branched-subunit amino acid transport system substrate-binding protein